MAGFGRRRCGGFAAVVAALALLRLAACTSVEEASDRRLHSSSTDASAQSTEGLWVCDPSVRHLLSQPEFSVDSGALMGRCQRTFTAAACASAQAALQRGKPLVESLGELCGPEQGQSQAQQAAAKASRMGADGGYAGQAKFPEGFGIMAAPIRVSGAAAKVTKDALSRTSFRGPNAPPKSGEAASRGDGFDKAMRGKAIGGQFEWEKNSRDTGPLSKAADAVRIYDAVALGSGASTRMEGSLAKPETPLARAKNISGGPDVQADVANAPATAPEVIVSSGAPAVTTAGPTLQQVSDISSEAQPMVYDGNSGTWVNATSEENAGGTPLPPEEQGSTQLAGMRSLLARASRGDRQPGSSLLAAAVRRVEDGA